MQPSFVLVCLALEFFVVTSGLEKFSSERECDLVCQSKCVRLPLPRFWPAVRNDTFRCERTKGTFFYSSGACIDRCSSPCFVIRSAFASQPVLDWCEFEEETRTQDCRERWYMPWIRCPAFTE